ncbi:DNA topoisomerase 3 [Defluviitalea phaphyphila]|uniref:DNA topoisomerase 3 n=1 Tax=Defluviitalea phaphyphila TaxID=1473580 RepID=UPI00072FACD9|nr:DNA topoisomerase 3 [Defluviitalea phaphyphila]
MKLVIAEKPSVAGEIAKVIGANKKEKGYYFGNDYYVSWCIGHLIENAMPEHYNPNLKKWSLDTLPFIPDKWITVVSEKTKEQYKILEQLIRSNKVKELICATDAGREGELIFRLVYNKTGTKKPFKRLWISSMEEEAIKNGFKNLKEGNEYENLYQAALSRMKADYLVGINATRLYSCMYNKTLNIGRVQSPTINLIVKRQREIENFKPVPYYVLIADCKNFKAYTKVNDKNTAKNIIAQCNKKKGKISKIKKQNKVENSSALFDLTALQREANKLLGYSAQQTLDVAQNLYESKLITYPRTDSRYLTDDMQTSTIELIKGLLNSNLLSTKTLKNYDIKKLEIQKVINNKKVSDHHAIIPTKNILKTDLNTFPTAEKNILILIIYRLLTAPYIARKYINTKLTVEIEGVEFTATGNMVIDNGFKEFQNHLMEIIKTKPKKEEKENPDNENIPTNIKEGQVIDKVIVTSQEKKTKPLPPYTEATLLSAMENISKFIKNEKLKEVIKDTGLGTPATRAGIIERIIKTGFIKRQGKNLIATQKAYTLMDLLPDKLKEPEMTAEWEKKLNEISKGKYSSNTFISEIETFVKKLVENSKDNYTTLNTKNIFKTNKEVLGKCPRCGHDVVELPKSYSCCNKNCGFAIWKEDKFFKDKKKTLTKKQVIKLLKEGKVKINGLYSAKKNTTYNATVILNDTGKYVNFKLQF